MTNPGIVSEIVLKIPMRKHLIHFCHFFEQGRVEDVSLAIGLAPTKTIGRLLDTVICSKKEYLRIVRDFPPGENPQNVLRLKINAAQWRRGEIFLTRKQEVWLEKTIYAIHRDLFLRHIKTAVGFGVTETEAIKTWQRWLGLEDPNNYTDTNFSMFKKISTIARQQSGEIFKRGKKPKRLIQNVSTNN